MKLENMVLNTAGFGALALGLGIALSATSADALSVNFESTSGESFTITDGGDNDGNNDDRALGSLGGFDVGGFRIGSVTATANDLDGSSTLQTTSLTVAGGGPEEFLTVTTSDDSFTAGANAPNQSDVSYSLGGSLLRGTLEGSGTVGDDENGDVTTEILSFNPEIQGEGSFSGDSQALAIVGDPFNMETTLMFGPQSEGGSNVNSTVDTAPSAIPLPAGAWLLLSALGGMGVLQYRRRTTV